MLPRHAESSRHSSLNRREDRSERPINPGHSAGHCDDAVLEEMLAKHLRGETQIRSSAECRTQSPAQTIGDAHIVRLTAERETGLAADFNATTDLFADHTIR